MAGGRAVDFPYPLAVVLIAASYGFIAVSAWAF
jgi:hypothetical protein